MEENLPLVTALAKRYQLQGVDWEDLLQSGRLGLVQAAKRYHPDKGSFGSFAAPWILGEIKACLRSRHTLHITRRGFEKLSQNKDKAIRLSDIAHEHHLSPEELAMDCLPLLTERGDLSEDKGLCEVDGKIWTQQALSSLSVKERQAVVMVVLQGKTQQQCAEAMGTTQGQISRLLTQAKRNLRYY